MKFRYYITELWNGQISGTNDEETAKAYAEGEDCFVVDTETGQWVASEGRLVEVTEIKKPSEEG